jgi:cysteinyl-tRNA synthetase
LDLRYFYLNSTYNSYQDFTWENLEQAKVSRINLIKKIAELFNKNSIINIQNQIKEIQNYEEFEVKFLQTQE